VLHRPRSGEEDVMRAAGYQGPQRLRVEQGQVLARGLDEVVSAVFSLSGSTPHLFGDRIGDFERDLRAVPAGDARVIAFLGSTVGNRDAAARQRLLSGLRGLLGDGDRLLVGMDLVKNLSTLEAAYDDAAGVTAEFNRNILRVVNRELRADFRPEAFRHVARWNDAASRIEMHLMPDDRQTAVVKDLGMSVAVEPGETIWTESCHKFTRLCATAMLEAAGLSLVSWHTDGAYALAVVAAR
jgi:L-histidine N-alpha-methyltransferase